MQRVRNGSQQNDLAVYDSSGQIRVFLSHGAAGISFERIGVFIENAARHYRIHSVFIEELIDPILVADECVDDGCETFLNAF